MKELEEMRKLFEDFINDCEEFIKRRNQFEDLITGTKTYIEEIERKKEERHV